MHNILDSNQKSAFDSENLFNEIVKLNGPQQLDIRNGLEWIIKNNIKAVLIGGMAVAHYLPVPRSLTPDTDFLIKDMESIKDLLNYEELEWRVLKIFYTDELGIRLPKFNMDLLDDTKGNQKLHELIFQHSKTGKIFGLDIPIISPEYLVLMKLAAARPKDERDAFDLLLSGTVNKAEYLKAIYALRGSITDNEGWSLYGEMIR
jgi:hypothetical protein